MKFHIRLLIVLRQTFIINCRAARNACLAFLCSGGLLLPQNHTSFWHSERLLSAAAAAASPQALASEGCLVHPAVTLLLLQQHGPTHQPRSSRSQKDFSGRVARKIIKTLRVARKVIKTLLKRTV